MVFYSETEPPRTRNVDAVPRLGEGMPAQLSARRMMACSETEPRRTRKVDALDGVSRWCPHATRAGPAAGTLGDCAAIGYRESSAARLLLAPGRGTAPPSRHGSSRLSRDGYRRDVAAQG